MGSKKDLGRAIIFGDLNYSYDEKGQTWSMTEGQKEGQNRMCEILTVREVKPDRILTDKFVLPISDAEIYNSPYGLTYCYNAALPYVKEVAHLAEVEENIVIGQAYLYAGKNIPTGKPNLLTWVLILFLGLLAVMGMTKK